MKRRETLLEVPRPNGRDLGWSGGVQKARRRRSWVKWLAQFHAVAILLLGVGWRYSAFLWPTWLLPIGVPIGGAHVAQGLLVLDRGGQLVRFTESGDLAAGWRNWITADERPDPGECLAVTPSVQRRLAGITAANAKSPRPTQFWVTVDLGQRFGPDQCGESDALRALDGLSRIKGIAPVPCSRQLFVANNFTCPSIGRPATADVPLIDDLGDYYPQDALRAGEEGRVVVGVERDQTGSPIKCIVLSSSGHASLDRQTCKLIGIDPNFTPHGPNGPGASGPIIQSVVWKIPS